MSIENKNLIGVSQFKKVNSFYEWLSTSLKNEEEKLSKAKSDRDYEKREDRVIVFRNIKEEIEKQFE